LRFRGGPGPARRSGHALLDARASA
jgi:hypothetical protein